MAREYKFQYYFETEYPCPFCKGHSEVSVYWAINEAFMGYEFCHVSCPACKAQSPTIQAFTSSKEHDIKEAIDEWIKVAKRCNSYKKAKWIEEKENKNDRT